MTGSTKSLKRIRDVPVRLPAKGAIEVPNMEPPGRGGVLIEWTPVRKRVLRKYQSRGDMAAVVKFMQKWSREDA